MGLLRSFLLLLVVTFVSGSCKKESEQKKEKPQNADHGGKGGAREKPEAPRGSDFSSRNGQVTVAKPADSSFECVQNQQSRGTVNVTMVKCRKTSGGFFFMLAKVYNVPSNQVLSAKKLATEVYMASYKRLFRNHRIAKQGPCKIQGHDGYEIELLAEHASKGAIHKKERVAVKGTNVVVVSAEGDPKQVEQNKKIIAAWFQGARFALLK